VSSLVSTFTPVRSLSFFLKKIADGRVAIAHAGPDGRCRCPVGLSGSTRDGAAASRGREIPPAMAAAAALPHQRLPQAPDVAAQRRVEQRRWRERQRARKAAQAQKRETSTHSQDCAEPGTRMTAGTAP
jgi:hypothetical protein